MTQTYDAIVIGAGVMGASIAFHLAERGLKVAILERKVTASGATGHSADRPYALRPRRRIRIDFRQL